MVNSQPDQPQEDSLSALAKYLTPLALGAVFYPKMARALGHYGPKQLIKFDEQQIPSNFAMLKRHLGEQPELRGGRVPFDLHATFPEILKHQTEIEGPNAYHKMIVGMKPPGERIAQPSHALDFTTDPQGGAQIDWLGTNPTFGFSMAEARAQRQALMDFARAMGVESVSGDPISRSRMRAFQHPDVTLRDSWLPNLSAWENEGWQQLP